MRSVSYRSAINAFVFTALWFAIGAFALWTPIPGALGIDPELFAVWFVVFFLALGAGGILLTLAALNGALARPTGPQPQRQRAQRRAGGQPGGMWPAQPARDHGAPRRNES
jgi:hypothetical protein